MDMYILLQNVHKYPKLSTLLTDGQYMVDDTHTISMKNYT